jgi:hypothetical protein
MWYRRIILISSRSSRKVDAVWTVEPWVANRNIFLKETDPVTTTRL